MIYEVAMNHHHHVGAMQITETSVITIVVSKLMETHRTTDTIRNMKIKLNT